MNTEFEAMDKVNEILEALSEEDTQKRVLKAVCAKFGVTIESKSGTTSASTLDIPGALVSEGGSKELPGIARLTESGKFELTVRDLKAKSANDAAVRIAHVVIAVHESLTGEGYISSRKVLVPILKEYRVYDGNTRVVIARHRGIRRDGDNLSLDAYSKREAERYIKEILDETTEGKWSPSSRSSMRRTG